MDVDTLRDDPTIPDQAELWRRIPPWHLVNDENLGRIRPSSAAFDNHPDGGAMSVLLGNEMTAAGCGPEAALAGHERFALAAITAQLARSCGQGIARDPLPDAPAHAVVFGEKTRLIRKKLAMAAHWVIPP